MKGERTFAIDKFIALLSLCKDTSLLAMQVDMSQFSISILLQN